MSITPSNIFAIPSGITLLTPNSLQIIDRIIATEVNSIIHFPVYLPKYKTLQIENESSGNISVIIPNVSTGSDVTVILPTKDALFFIYPGLVNTIPSYYYRQNKVQISPAPILQYLNTNLTLNRTGNPYVTQQVDNIGSNFTCAIAGAGDILNTDLHFTLFLTPVQAPKLLVSIYLSINITTVPRLLQSVTLTGLARCTLINQIYPMSLGPQSQVTANYQKPSIVFELEVTGTNPVFTIFTTIERCELLTAFIISYF